MKTTQKLWLLVIFAMMGAAIWAMFAEAQSSLTVAPGSTLASCPTPAAKALIFCNVAGDSGNPDGAYVSANGAAYALVQLGATGGVASWNGRTGKVLPSANDYSYSQLSGAPTTISCTSGSVGSGGLTGSGCTIK